MTKETLYKNLLEFSNGDEKFIKEIVDLFIADTSSEVELMVSYKNDNKKKELILLAHKLIPRFDIFGLTDALKLTKKIENDTNYNSEKELYEDIDKLILICKDIIYQLKNI